nr:MAG TPA: hypothetical protein [Caudoviricetes sp.]
MSTHFWDFFLDFFELLLHFWETWYIIGIERRMLYE